MIAVGCFNIFDLEVIIEDGNSRVVSAWLNKSGAISPQLTLRTMYSGEQKRF